MFVPLHKSLDLSLLTHRVPFAVHRYPLGLSCWTPMTYGLWDTWTIFLGLWRAFSFPLFVFVPTVIILAGILFFLTNRISVKEHHCEKLLKSCEGTFHFLFYSFSFIRFSTQKLSNFIIRTWQDSLDKQRYGIKDRRKFREGWVYIQY